MTKGLGALGLVKAQSKVVNTVVSFAIALGALALVYILFFPTKLVGTALRPLLLIYKTFMSCFPERSYARNLIFIFGLRYLAFPVHAMRFFLVFQSFKFLLRMLQSRSAQANAAKHYQDQGMLTNVPGLRLLLYCIHESERKLSEELNKREQSEDIDEDGTMDISSVQHEGSIYAKVAEQRSVRARAVLLWYLNVASCLVFTGLSLFIKGRATWITGKTYRAIVLTPFACSFILAFLMDLHHEALPPELQTFGSWMVTNVQASDNGSLKTWNDFAVGETLNIMRPLIWSANEVRSILKATYRTASKYMGRNDDIRA